MRTHKLLMLGIALLLWGMFVFPANAQYLAVPGMSSHAQGAGVAVGNLDENDQPEMILMTYHHAKGGNTFRYKVGKDLAPDGTAASWSDSIEVEGVGKKALGAGAVLWDINANKTLDLVFMAYEKNLFRYKVGWDLNANGIASSWSDVVEVEGVGDMAEGAGAALGDIDGNGRPELVLMAYDSPEGPNSFRYRIGWNINAGAVTTNWSGEIVPGVSEVAEGAGIGIADLNSDGTPEIILLATERQKGANPVRYKIGWSLNASAKTQEWKQIEEPALGSAFQGADLAFWDMVGSDAPEMILMVYEREKGGNTFRYRVTGIRE